MSATNDRYNALVSRSQLTNNLGNDSYIQINNALIPCDEIIQFYKDSLFYMHFYNTLYLEFYLQYQTTQIDLATFDELIKKLKIIFDNSDSSSDLSNKRLGKLDITGTTATFTFYINLFKKYYHNTEYYAYYDNTKITAATNKVFKFDINLPKNDPTSIGGQSATANISINLSTGNILNTGDERNPNYINVLTIGYGFPADRTIYNSDYNPPLVNLNVNNGIFGKYFTNRISDLEIRTNSNGSIISIKPLTSIRGSTSQTSLIKNINFTEFSNFHPQIESIPLIYTGTEGSSSATNLDFDFNYILDVNIRTGFSSPSSHEFVYDTTKQYNTEENIINNNYNNIDVRKKQFRRVIESILSTNSHNFFGFLLYQKINYNVIVCNIAIQLKLRKEYLNTMIDFSQTEAQLTGSHATYVVTYINKHILNLSNLRKISTIATSDYVSDKKSAVGRINLLNNLKQNFNETLEGLNSAVNTYNRYTIYYSNLKKYASSIIVFIIMLIIASILITLSTSIDNNAKNSYYIIILCILIILIIIYHLKFRHVSLYENFATAAATIVSISSHATAFRLFENTFSTNCSIYNNGKNILNPSVLSLAQQSDQLNTNRNNAAFFNELFQQSIPMYNYTYSLLSNELSSAIYVSNNKIFSEGNNDYLYKLYLEKSKHNELNKLKIVKYANIIEAIKKQIIYIFNIALLLGLITIVLVTCLMFYNYGVVSIATIITFAVIALIIIMFYISYIMIQQTRMIANKKYWSVNNPSEVTLNQL